MKDKITIKKPKTNSAATYIYSSKVTKALKKIFPGLLQAAYIRKEEADYFDNYKELCLNAVDVILEFTNGVLVKYWNSEWGGLDKVDPDDE
jgi:hypothetical protein